MSSTPLGPALTAWLALLLAVWAGLLFGGFAFDRLSRSGKPLAGPRTLRWTRLTSSLILVIAAWSWEAVAWTTPARSYGLLIAAGMTLGFAGDLFMAGVGPVTQDTLRGMAAFGLGHAAYITAMIGYEELNRIDIWIAAWAVWLVFGAIGWYGAVYRGARPATALHWAALPYTLLLSSTAGVATGAALHAAAFVPLALGAVLFLFSDLLIAVGMFSQRRSRLMNDLIWLTYGPGQMLIVYSTGIALIKL